MLFFFFKSIKIDLTLTDATGIRLAKLYAEVGLQAHYKFKKTIKDPDNQ